MGLGGATSHIFSLPYSAWAFLELLDLKSIESIPAIDMKLGGLVEHYYLINYNRTHSILTS